MLLKVFLIFCILQPGYSKEKSNKKDVFQATHEWKEIEEGQKVPSGLHYRINLSTGKKEAKIIGNDDIDPTNAFSLVNVDEKDTRDIDNKGTIKIPKDEAQKIKTRYRSIKELKKELGDLNLNPKSEAEIMSELFSKFEEVSEKRQPDKKRILSILEDLVYLSHQIDNANEFVRLNGFQKIILKNMNSTDDQILQDTLRLFSSLVQNNSKVKIHALECGILSKLLKILNLNTSSKVQYSTLTALSCLLRTFPFAQNSFIELGGVNVFAELLGTSDTKLKLKIITLIDDLLSERNIDTKNFEGHKMINLKEILKKLRWCDHLNNLLSELSLIDLNDHDSIEKCLAAMNSIMVECKGVFEKDILMNLNARYEVLANKTAEEDLKEYFRSLGELSLSLISRESHPRNHDEQEL